MLEHLPPVIFENRLHYKLNQLAMLAHFHGSVRQADIRKIEVFRKKLWQVIDVIFREDAARARKDNSPLNMNVLRKTALSLVEKAIYGRVSKKKMMFKAALNPQVLLNILFPKK